MQIEQKTIEIGLLEPNKGQLKGLPKNPRIIKDNRFKALKQSIKDSPEFIELRELLVYPLSNGKYIVIAGNQRLSACIDLKFKEIPCKVLPASTSIEKLKEYTIKDNVSFGVNDWEDMSEWDAEQLKDWGEDIQDWEEPSQKSTTSVKQIKANMTKSIKIDFDAQDYDAVLSTIKALRSEGINVGNEIKKALVKLSTTK